MSHTNSARPARPVANQSGFTLVELVVALTVGVLLLTAAVSFVSRTARILHRLRIEREIRDSGLLAVEAIEKGFRSALEYGGKVLDISDSRVVAGGPEYTVSLEAKGDVLELKVLESEAPGLGDSDGTQSSTTCWPGGDLKCRSLRVRSLVDDCYVDGSAPGASNGRVIVIQFELGEDVYGISRPFKAAFAARKSTDD